MLEVELGRNQESGRKIFLGRGMSMIMGVASNSPIRRTGCEPYFLHW